MNTRRLRSSRANVKRLSAFVPGHSTYFAIYFTLTALHGLHVLGGALVIFYIWGPGAKMWKARPGAVHEPSGSVRDYSGISLTWFGFSCSPFCISSKEKYERSFTRGYQKHVKTYILIFVALLVGTIITVGLNAVHFDSMAVTISIALFVACIKAFLVAGFFMHLFRRRRRSTPMLAGDSVFLLRDDVSYRLEPGRDAARHPVAGRNPCRVRQPRQAAQRLKHK